MIGLHLDAAIRRSRRQRADQAEAVFVGTHCDSKGLFDYQTNILVGKAAMPLPPEALEGALRHHLSKLPVIDLAQYLKSRGK